jgi:hypothetical protein
MSGGSIQQMSTTNVQVDSALVTWALGALGAVVFFLVSILLRVGYRDMRERIDLVEQLKNEVTELRIKLSKLESDHEREVSLINAQIERIDNRMAYALSKG